MESSQFSAIPRAFVWRRVHSLLGLWLVLFLIEHLLVNSQAALFVGDNGIGFVHAVNSIKDLPYLPVIEIVFLAIPFLMHGLWGVKYLLTGESNSLPSDGSSIALPQFARNHAYTWQRVTSWILLFAITGHVIHMRFIQYPDSAHRGTDYFYISRLHLDNGLYTLSKRLGFEVYDQQQVHQMENQLLKEIALLPDNGEDSEHRIAAQQKHESEAWLAALQRQQLQPNQVLAISTSFGIAELLMVRDAFKDPVVGLLYTGLVLASCFHAFNGLWTFLITWGVSLTAASQRMTRRLSTGLMLLIGFLGLTAIWGTYWFNLKQ
jgi:succinate dehydrogenase / fumarate reductase cytochrome b subunit